MNTQENQIAGTPPAPAKRKVRYGKISPEAKANLKSISSEARKALTAGLEADSKMESIETNYKMLKFLPILWWLWNIGLTIQMLYTITMARGSRAEQQLVGFSKDTAWMIPIAWLANLVLARLVYELVSAVFEILYRLRAQDDDMRSVKQAVESLQQHHKVNSNAEGDSPRNLLSRPYCPRPGVGGAWDGGKLPNAV